jgi:hypothetical protein
MRGWRSISVLETPGARRPRWAMLRRRREAPVQLIGEQQVGKFWTGRMPPGVGAALEAEVIEVNVGPDAMAQAADGNDPGTIDQHQSVEQQARHREMAEVVGRSGRRYPRL